MFEKTPGSTWTEKDWAIERERQASRAERAEAENKRLRAALKQIARPLGATSLAHARRLASEALGPD